MAEVKCKECGTPHEVLQNIVNGSELKPETLEKIAKALDATMDYLETGREQKSDQSPVSEGSDSHDEEGDNKKQEISIDPRPKEIDAAMEKSDGFEMEEVAAPEDGPANNEGYETPTQLSANDSPILREILNKIKIVFKLGKDEDQELIHGILDEILERINAPDFNNKQRIKSASE